MIGLADVFLHGRRDVKVHTLQQSAQRRDEECQNHDDNCQIALGILLGLEARITADKPDLVLVEVTAGGILHAVRPLLLRDEQLLGRILIFDEIGTFAAVYIQTAALIADDDLHALIGLVIARKIGTEPLHFPDGILLVGVVDAQPALLAGIGIEETVFVPVAVVGHILIGDAPGDAVLLTVGADDIAQLEFQGVTPPFRSRVIVRVLQDFAPNAAASPSESFAGTSCAHENTSTAA